MKKLLIILVIGVFGVAYAQNTNYNYIQERTYTDETTSESASQTVIAYYDGLGRPIQQVQKGASPVDGQDIITHIEYEPNIGKVKDYLPYAGSGVNFATNARQETLGFYNTAKYQSTSNPYSEQVLDRSPLNRIVEQGFPGNDWDTKNTDKHTVEYNYSTNTLNEVRVYMISTNWDETRGAYISSFSPIRLQYYEEGTLYKTIVKNENWKTSDGKNNTTEEFTNKLGQLILKRVYNNGNALDTYYVYDKYGNLSYVLPPLSNGLTDNNTLNKLCYQYNYDERNRLVEKKLPGKEWEYIVYDKADRVVMTGSVYSPFGDETKGWLFSKYDAMNRVVYTGFYNGHSVTAANRKAIKEAVYAQTDNNESKSNSTLDGVAIGYSNVKFPTSSINLLTVNYYDNYDFPNAPTSFPSVGGKATVQDVKGLPTGSWTRVITTPAERKATQSYTLYNARYQPLRTYTKNHLGGFTQIDSELTFTGLPTKTTTQHRYDANNSKGSVMSIVDNYTYDQQERLLKHTQKIGSNPEQLIAENIYDDLGTLVIKNVGGLETAAEPLQMVDYKYNVRGWLTDINSNYETGIIDLTFPNTLFNLKINYNQIFEGDDDTQPQYNGNISSVAWRTKSDNQVRGYAFDYDHLNRLNYASHLKFVPSMQQTPILGGINGYKLVINYYRTGQYAEDLTYDKNGNILSLDRYGQEVAGQPIQLDELNYTYDGNRLLKVTDGTNNPDGFKDGTNTGNDYTYDTMGNLKTDQNKGITAIKYNHLNLPTEVTFTTGKITYTYDAVGTKVGKKVEPNSGLVKNVDYLDGFQYEDNDLQFFFQPEGFVEKKLIGNGDLSYFKYVYHYIYKDHLGNNRLIYADLDENGIINPITEIIEENNYYPFGLRHQGYNELATENPSGFKYKYQEQERNEELGLNWDSFKWRNYDYAIGRFLNIDPLSEKYPYNSTYAFQENKMGLGRELEGLELVFTHGTWAKREDKKVYTMDIANYTGGSTWQKTFSENIAKSTGWNANSTYEFTWTGNNNTDDRKTAGQKLAENLMSDNNPFKESKHATLVGHSHGGNVNKEAKNILEENGWTVDIINIATPQRTDHQSKKTGDGEYLNFYNTNDVVQYAGAKPKTSSEGARKDSKADLNQAVNPSNNWFKNSGGHSIHQDSQAQEEILEAIKNAF